MGISEKSVWYFIHNYHEYEGTDFENMDTTLQQAELPSNLTFTEIKATIYEWAKVSLKDNTKVIKLRRFDQILVPYSFILKGSSKEKPFIIDVVRLHQFCPVSKRKLPPGYVNAIKSKLSDLEKRVGSMENSFPEMASTQMSTVEEKADQLSNCISFLDRRLDELAPPKWKNTVGMII